MDHLVYLDHAATTAARPEVVEAMLPYFTEKYGNPSSIYSLGSETKAAITHAREVMAKSIGTTPENIYFTAGGREILPEYEQVINIHMDVCDWRIRTWQLLKN